MLINFRRTSRALAANAAALLIMAAVISANVPTRPATIAQASADPLTMLPASDFVMVVDVQRILNEMVPQLLASNQTALGQMNAALNDLQVKTGIDARGVRRIAIGIRGIDPKILASGESFPGVVIVQGIDADKLLNLIQQDARGGATQTQYAGRTINTFTPDSRGAKTGTIKMPISKISFTALDANTVVVGDLPLVEAAIDVSDGRGTRVSDELVALATRNQNAVISLAGNVPPALAAQALAARGASPLPVSDEFVKAASSIKQFFASIGLTASGYNFLMGARAANSVEAKTVSDTLAAFKALAAMHASSAVQKSGDKAFREMIEGIQISTVGDDVEIKAEVTHASINDLTKLALSARPSSTSAASVNKRQPARRRGVRRGARRR